MTEIQTSERLLDAAIDVIDSVGVKGIRVRAIAATAGVREPAVYHYFGSRDGLIEAALLKRYERDLAEMVTAFDSMTRTCHNLEEFRRVVKGMMQRICSAERALVRSVRADVIGSAQSRPQLAEKVIQMQRLSNEGIAATVAWCQFQGWVRHDLSAPAFAVWLNGMVNGRVLYEMDPEQCEATAWDSIAVETVEAALFGTTK